MGFIKLFQKGVVLTLVAIQQGWGSQHSSREELATFLPVSFVKRELFDKQNNCYTYHHYACHPQDGEPIEEIYKKLIEKGEKILSHLYKSNESFPHQLEILQNYKAYSPYWLQHGLTLGGISWLRGPSLPQLQQYQAHLESVIAIVWALTKKSFHKGDIFDRGAFIIPDEKFKLLHFFQDYSLQVSGHQSWDAFVEDKHFLGCNLAYSRTSKNVLGLPLSSHFPQRTIFQVGIDCRFGPSEQPMPFLPFAMSHLLVGKVTTSNGHIVTFIKPEPSGICDVRSLFFHGLSYFLDNQGTYLRREKDIPVLIAEKAFRLAHSLLKNPPFEILSSSFYLQVKALTDQNCLTIEKFQESKTLDIASLWEMIQLILKASSPTEIYHSAQDLNTHLLHLYTDDIKYRTGNEVLLNIDELTATDRDEGTDLEEGISFMKLLESE